MKLERSFFEQDTNTVAKGLLMKALVFGNKTGLIVETESYIGPEDKASHASWKKMESCLPMWGPAGYSYVYMVYGMHYMLNISTEKNGFPATVLIRAIEPLKNIDLPTNGPGKLTKALGIDKNHDNIDLTNSYGFYVSDFGEPKTLEISATPRIGINYAREYRDKPWRFFVKNNPFVSKAR